LAERLTDREAQLQARLERQSEFWSQWRQEEETAATKRAQLVDLLRRNKQMLDEKFSASASQQ
jgi:uncharacterized membrane-anchored protein YhcB (DUF1043 family)